MRRHQTRMRENGGNFIFISLLNPTGDENWFANIVCCSSSFKNDAVDDVPIHSNFFCEQQINWTLPHFCVHG